jgi:hypothetical protein
MVKNKSLKLMQLIFPILAAGRLAHAPSRLALCGSNRVGLSFCFFLVKQKEILNKVF